MPHCKKENPVLKHHTQQLSTRSTTQELMFIAKRKYQCVITLDIFDCVLEILEWKNTRRKCDCRPKHIEKRQQQDGNEYIEMSR